VTGPVTGPVTDQPHQPPLVLIKGDATDEEVAALVAVLQGLASAASASASEPAVPRSTWAAPARQVRTPHHAGPGGWRASALPR
jgi:hypothetical protein